MNSKLKYGVVGLLAVTGAASAEDDIGQFAFLTGCWSTSGEDHRGNQMEVIWGHGDGGIMMASLKLHWRNRIMRATFLTLQPAGDSFELLAMQRGETLRYPLHSIQRKPDMTFAAFANTQYTKQDIAVSFTAAGDQLMLTFTGPGDMDTYYLDPTPCR